MSVFSLNKVMLAGNLTRDPEVRFFANEKAVANFGLAISRRFKGNDGQMKDETVFVDVEAWGRTAELVGQYLTKGRSCYIEGRLKLDSWEDKENGQKRSKLRVVADNVQFLSDGRNQGGERAPGGQGGGEQPGRESEGSGPNQATAAPSRPAPAPADDEPPF